jgi:CDP-diacylglycerol--glycerol-3-phosphate 3-phosphatidyltransferase
MGLNLPNCLTWLRIVLIPVLGLMFLLPYPWSNAIAAFLDPVADKLIVAVALVVILTGAPTVYVAFPVAVIIGREIAVSALREWMAEIGQRTHVSVGIMGKIKTVAQMIAIILLLYEAPVFGISTFTVGLWLLYVAAVLTIYSMIIYLHAAWRGLEGSSGDAGTA